MFLLGNPFFSFFSLSLFLLWSFIRFLTFPHLGLLFGLDLYLELYTTRLLSLALIIIFDTLFIIAHHSSHSWLNGVVPGLIWAVPVSKNSVPGRSWRWLSSPLSANGVVPGLIWAVPVFKNSVLGYPWRWLPSRCQPTVWFLG